MKTAYPQVLGTCSITLYSNVPFDNTYANHSLISKKFLYNNSAVFTGSDSLVPCEMFLNRKNPNILGAPRYYPSYALTGDFNFNFSNGLLGSVTLELNAEQTNANYMKLVSGTDVYYYFITGINQVNFETYTLSLELDVLMTYQDEFLEGMKNMPVFTQRKMCYRYTNDGLYPHCADYKTGESTFAGVKPSLIKEKLQMKLGYTDSINKIKWLYFCVDEKYAHIPSSPITTTDREIWAIARYSYDDAKFPLVMCVVPINVTSFTLTDGDNETITLSSDDIRQIFDNLISEGEIHGAKISSYPPYILSSGDSITIDGSGNVTLTSSNVSSASSPTNYTYYDNGKTTLIALPTYWKTGFIISNEQRIDYELSKVELDIKNLNKPTPLSSRYLDPKLLFSPFKKYLLMSTYSSGNEFFPELIYSDGVYKSKDFKFATTYTSYIGDYTIFTYQKSLTDANSKVFFNNYKENNIGLSATINYTMPVGTNALDVFNATQSQTFYTSKVASGVTSGLSIVGGIASIGVGVASENPMLIAGGATAIVGGVAGAVTAIKSTNAKIEDLKNTPDAINVQGGSYVGDYARNSDIPFIVVYDVSSAVKEQANDFFYNYGYEVARECYFNLELKDDFETSGDVDTNLFSRDIFNYIKLHEDITNKINANIPLIVKQKLSKIFNDGITLWSWFGHDELWKNGAIYLNQNYWLDRWFLKCDLDNSEIGFAISWL